MTKEESSVKICRKCTRTADLAQCPECRLWFCRIHDRHECIPEQVARQQNRIAAIKNRRSWGERIILGGAVFGLSCLAGILEGLADVEFNWHLHGSVVATITSVVVASFVLGYIIRRHYNHQLRQLGVRFRRIRPPETAKKDR